MISDRSNDEPVVSELQPRRIHPKTGQIGVDRFQISLLGSFRLSHCGSPVDIPSREQKLLALLALRGQTSRSRLAGILWPEATEARALASLRTSLWRVQHVAPEVLIAMGCTVEVDRRVRVDAREFVDHATSTLQYDRAHPPPKLEDVSHGDLLVDWDDDWLTSDRERMRQLRLHLLEALSERLSRDGRFGLALEFALAALSQDVLRESAHRAVIRAHLAEGNMAEAQRAFSRCVMVLEQELGVEPSSTTTELLPRRLATHAFSM